MDIPQSASGVHPNDEVAEAAEAFIQNPYAARDLLTVQEAVDLINHISGVLLVHERTGRHAPGIAKNQVDL